MRAPPAAARRGPLIPLARPSAADGPAPGGRPLRGRALFAALAALLAAAAVPVACGERRDGAELAALEAGIASAQASLSVLSAGGASAPAAPPPLGAGASPFRQVGAALPLPGARPFAASSLVGAGPDALRRWFGEPDLRRPEGDAEVRLYLGPGCALDVVLYPEAAGGRRGAGGGMRVHHAAARADGAAAVTEADCLRGVGGDSGAGRAAAAGQIGGR